MRQRVKMHIEAQGTAQLVHELQHNCRPRRFDGECEEVFYRRMAIEYDMTVSEVMEMLG